MGTSSGNTTLPIDHTLNPTWPQHIRDLKFLLQSRLILSDTEPAARTDSQAFDSTDLGSIWIHGDSTIPNEISVLTAITPTWTPISTNLLATIVATANVFTALQTISMSNPALILTNTDSEDGAGERDSVLQFKGTQSGDELTTLAKITASHSGTADDEAGKIEIALNDGADTNAPSSKALTLYTDPAESADAFIDVANSKIVLDEDDLTSDSALKLATQQSIKAYVDAAILAGAEAKYDGTTITGSLSTTDSWVTNGVDFSGVLTDSKRYLCYMLVQNNSGNSISSLAFRSGGSSDTIDVTAPGASGANGTVDANFDAYVIVISSTAGKFDYYTNQGPITVTLLSYIRLT